jgi:hypothetical protein
VTIHPLFFQFQESVSGLAFNAAVSGTGRVLGVCEDDDAWWFYGVEPGGVAECGDTPKEAHLAFLESFRGVLLDIAQDAADFDAFRHEVREFFHSIDASDDARWVEASRALRQGSAEPSSDFPDLPRWRPEDTETAVEVVRLDVTLPKPAPAINVMPVLATPA